VNFITKNDFIYEKLKDEIVEGKLRPGERIIIPDVAKRYGISAMPIREALNRLQQEGLIEIVPHVGARVASFDLARFKEITMIRTELETLATKLATPYIDEATLAKLEALYEEMQVSLQEGDQIRYGKINKEFHMTVYSAGPYPVLRDMIASLWARSEFSRTVFLKVSNRLEASQSEHREWLEAIKKKDAEKASQTVRRQKEIAFAMLFAELEKEQNQ